MCRSRERELGDVRDQERELGDVGARRCVYRRKIERLRQWTAAAATCVNETNSTDKAKLHFPDLLHHHPPPHSPATLALSPVYNFSLRRKSSVGEFQLDYDLEQQITSLESFFELDGDTVEQPESIR
ncbi:hypothetical protein YC2023_079297 [Brassica napus]